jgi:hypothetical protein
MNIYNDRMASAAQQPVGPLPDGQAKKFEAVKDSAFREDLVTNNGGVATPHVMGLDDVTKAKFDSAIDNAKSDLDSMSDKDETESLRLQMAMDRVSKLMSTLSNVLKKVSDTAEGITANLK